MKISSIAKMVAGAALALSMFVGAATTAQASIYSTLGGSFHSILPHTGQLADPAVTSYTYTATDINAGGTNLYAGATDVFGGAGTINLAALASLTLDTGDGTFAAASVVTSLATGLGSNNQTRTIELLGTFTPANQLTGLPAASSGLTLTLNQTGGAGGTISGSYTLSTPATFTNSPEPASMAVLGVGLAALGLIRRRRQS